MIKFNPKRHRNLNKLIIILVIIIINTVIFLNHKLLLPNFEDISKHFVQTHVITNSKLATGNFPIDINARSDYQLNCCNNMIVVLYGSYICFYSYNGKLIKKRQHNFANAVMKPCGKRVLIYESNGKKISIEDKNRVIYHITLEKDIIFSRLSSNGYTAVVTISDYYVCEMRIYNYIGNVIYQRKCMELISDISFNRDGTSSCRISYLCAKNGTINTYIKDISFTKDYDTWTSSSFDTIGLDLFCYNDKSFLIGINACGYADKNGKITSFYHYDGNLVGHDETNGKVAVIIYNDIKKKWSIMLLSFDKTDPVIIDLDDKIIDVIIENELVYVMTNGFIYAYDFSGDLQATAKIRCAYTGFVKLKKYVFLKGVSKIDRINF